MKKTLIIALCAALLTSMLLTASCAPSSVNSQPVKLTLWHYYNGAAKDTLDVLVQEFNETEGTEKNIIIDAYSYSSVSSLAEAVIASANGDLGAAELPDIFASYSDNALTLDNLGVLASIDKYFSEEELSAYREEFLEEGRFGDDNELKIVPVAKSSEVFYLNATDFGIFAAATGASVNDLATWEGIAKTARAYFEWTDAKTPEANDGKALFGIDSFANFMLIGMKQLGNDLYMLNADGTYSFNLDEASARRMYDSMVLPYMQGYFASVGRFRSDDAKVGDLLAYVGSTAGALYFPTQIELDRDTSYTIECEILPFPVFEGGEKFAVQQGAGMVVSKSDEARERSAVEFLKWFTSPENNLNFALSTGYMPVENAALTQDALEEATEATVAQGEEQSIVGSLVNQTIFENMIVNYTLFANKPFVGSYIARNEIEAFMLDYDAKAIAERDVALNTGLSFDEVSAQMASEESFQAWYLDFTQAIQASMGE